MSTGTVKWFSSEKGYGFITPEGDGGGKDLFVHYTGIQSDDSHKNLEEGQKVQYDEGMGDKGPVAENVQII